MAFTDSGPHDGSRDCGVATVEPSLASSSQGFAFDVLLRFFAFVTVLVVSCRWRGIESGRGVYVLTGQREGSKWLQWQMQRWGGWGEAEEATMWWR